MQVRWMAKALVGLGLLVLQLPLPSVEASTRFASAPSKPLRVFHDSDDGELPLSTTEMGDGPARGYRSVIYYVDWAIYGRQYFPWQLPSENLTHVLFGFGNVKDDGQVFLSDSWSDLEIHWRERGDTWDDPGNNLYGCCKQLQLLKQENRNLKVLLSIGGWTYSQNGLAAKLSTPEARQNFADSAVDLVKNVGLDGLDIDWEYPNNTKQASDFVDLLRRCREGLDQYSRSVPSCRHSHYTGRQHNNHEHHHFELTVASPADPAKLEIMDAEGMDRYLDFWNVMAYDFSGTWSSATGHLANLYPSKKNPNTTLFSIAETMDAYVSRAGIHPSKLVLGLPVYGRSFLNTDGLGAPFVPDSEGSFENGVYDFKSLPLPGSEEYYDDETGSSYCYHPGTRRLVSYDTVGVQREKAQYIKNHDLGGAMWWESSSDKADARDSLVANVVEVLGGPRALRQDTNCVRYPKSCYDNVRQGFK